MRTIRWLAIMALVLCACAARAACLPYADQRLDEYDAAVRASPRSAANALTAELATLGDADPAYRASLLVMLGQAYTIQEEHEKLRAAVSEGLALTRDPLDPNYVNLLHLDSTRPVESEELVVALDRSESALKEQVPGSPGEACVLLTLGSLEHMADHIDLASMHLTRAYRMSTGEARKPQRMEAAGVLAVVMVALRDYKGARGLTRELIEWFEERESLYELSAAYYIEGFVLMKLADRTAAQTALERARDLSRTIGDTLGVAYADMNLCINSVGMGDTSIARSYCEPARLEFAAAHLNEPHKQVLLSLAEIDTLEKKYASALTLLNNILDQDGRDLPPFRLADVYKLRAESHRALGNHEAALADFENYMQRFIESKDDERAKDAAAMRARFETDREVERNEFLERRLVSERERLSAQTARLRWMIAAAIASLLVIALLGYSLLTNKRQKRLLARLAQEDELTGLPNRRYTLTRATEAFHRMHAKSAPFAIAILDLDHFKRINDQLGHAAGDYVLKSFAQIGRESLRETDILGRWGGEEFLILLPNTPLDLALQVVERVRAAASQIAGGPLPEGFNVTLSAGLATLQTDAATLEQTIGYADAALYTAKERGRNLVQVAQESYDASTATVRTSLKKAGIDLKTGQFDLMSIGSTAR